MTETKCCSVNSRGGDLSENSGGGSWEILESGTAEQSGGKVREGVAPSCQQGPGCNVSTILSIMASPS
jgi:hypothetical protein